MEKFKSVLQKRIALMGAFNGLAIIFIALTGAYGNRAVSANEEICDMIHGFQIGIFIGIQIVMLFFIGKYLGSLKNTEKLQKLYVEENDERTRLIQDKIGGVGLSFTLGSIATGTVISGFFNLIVFSTLVGVLIFSVLVEIFLMIYYNHKF